MPNELDASQGREGPWVRVHAGERGGRDLGGGYKSSRPGVHLTSREAWEFICAQSERSSPERQCAVDLRRPSGQRTRITGGFSCCVAPSAAPHPPLAATSQLVPWWSVLIGSALVLRIRGRGSGRISCCWSARYGNCHIQGLGFGPHRHRPR